MLFTTADLAELWRRIAFSVVVNNTDDHLRNHGFVHESGGWRLSPGATEIDLHLGRWFAQRLGLPEGAGGYVTSGGAMSAFVGPKIGNCATVSLRR